MNEATPRGPDLGDPIIGSSDEQYVDFRTYGLEDWVAFGFFWLLAFVVFLQFFTRYILNDSLAWTEEIARYLLIGVTFVGAGMAVRKNSHIHVEFFYVYLPRGVAKALSSLVDLVRLAFYAYGTWLAWQVTLIMDTQRMVVIDLPMSWVFGAGFVGFAIMTVRAAQVTIQHWRAGSSALTRVHDEGRRQ